MMVSLVIENIYPKQIVGKAKRLFRQVRRAF